MQQKLCLWLCLLVLFGALCAGNPFLPAGAVAAPLVAPAGAGSDGASQPGAPDAGGVHFALATPPSSPAIGGAVSALSQVLPVNAAAPAVAVRDRGTLAPRCPDARLEPLVVGVERGPQGEPVWVLRGGQRWRRNPLGDTPLLVPAVGPAPGK